MKMLIAAAVAALFAAAPAFAAQDNVQDKKPEETKTEKRICRSLQVTGSMMAKRECHTAVEWKQQDDQNAANVDALRNRPPSAVPR